MLIMLVILCFSGLGTLLIVAASKPSSFVYKRSILIRALPEEIYANVDDFHHWAGWSPWENIDPNMVRTYGGATFGKGAKYSWSGNGRAGAGAMEVTSAQPGQTLHIVLNLEKPFRSSHQIEFQFARDGDLTEVTWSMSGPQPFISKIMGTLLNLDAVVGKDLEKGLASLKDLSES